MGFWREPSFILLCKLLEPPGLWDLWSGWALPTPGLLEGTVAPQGLGNGEAALQIFLLQCVWCSGVISHLQY